MIMFQPTTDDHRFAKITVSAATLNAMTCKDGFPFHVGAGGEIGTHLPQHVRTFHNSRYCDRYAEIMADRTARRPVLRLSDRDEIAAGRSPITVVDGLETIAALIDAGIDLIEIEVLRSQATEIEARLI